MEKLSVRVLEKINEFDNLILTTAFRTDRIDRMHQAMKSDVSRHEALAYEIAAKFEVHS